MHPQRPAHPLVSLVVPVLDEERCIDELVRRVAEALAPAGVRHELVFVDDGSRDGTPERIAAARKGDPRVKSLRLTRSFGHQNALLAGLRFARGDAVVTLDGDLQHPPECVPELVARWREGFDVVHAIRAGSQGGSAGKDWSSRLFYALMRRLSGVAVVPSAADFRLLDRRVVGALNDLSEHFVFVRGLVPWLGFRETAVHYEVDARFAGESKYGVRRMLRLALDGILSFSVVPLRLITWLGLATSLFGVAFGIFSVLSWAFGFDVEPGWTSLVTLILVFGGAQLLSLGVLAEYVARTYEETKRRPRYVIEDAQGFEDP